MWVDSSAQQRKFIDGSIKVAAEADFKALTAIWLRAYKNVLNIGLSTAVCFLSFPKESEGLQVKLPLVTLFDFMWGNLERCHQFDDGTRQIMKLAYQEALVYNVCSNLLELQKDAGLLSWNQAGEIGFTFACHLANKLEIKIIWDPFNEYTIASAPNITQATLAIKTKLRLGIQIEDEQIQVECLNIDEAEFMTTITGQGRRYSIQCDGQ